MRRTDEEGGLSGKIVYVHTRHASVLSAFSKTWTTERMTNNASCLLMLIPLYACLISILSFPATGFIHSYVFVNSNTRESELAAAAAASPKPIDPSGWPDRFPAKEHCSKCGLCETSFVSRVSDACAFLDEGMARIDDLEVQVHGRRREGMMLWSDETTTIEATADEGRFGVMHQPMMLARGVGIPNAQWTGCVTGIALSMLEAGVVDAVVCVANESSDKWSSPQPIIAKTKEDVLRGRGVKPALAPSLNMLDEIKQDTSIRRLLLCGVGCAVQAFRSVQDELGLEEVYVLGTNCADNSPTPQAAENFIQNGVRVDDAANVRGYEFMQDFRVHVKTDDSYITKPYFTLPGAIAKESIAPSCLACFDYTNALADVVVGYMGAPLERNARMDCSYQTLTIRNERGKQMVNTALSASRLELYEPATGTGSHEKLASATVASDGIVLEMVGGSVPEEGMPMWMGEIMASVMTFVGPKGVSFARYSIDYHLLRNYLHILDVWGEERAQIALPQYARDIVDRYLQNDKAFAQLKDKIIESK